MSHAGNVTGGDCQPTAAIAGPASSPVKRPPLFSVAEYRGLRLVVFAFQGGRRVFGAARTQREFGVRTQAAGQIRLRCMPPDSRRAPGQDRPTPLTSFAERQYITSAVVNSPENLAEWIVNPKQIEPTTAMPDLDIQTVKTLDVVGYLYTLEKTEAVSAAAGVAGDRGVATK